MLNHSAILEDVLNSKLKIFCPDNADSSTEVMPWAAMTEGSHPQRWQLHHVCRLPNGDDDTINPKGILILEMLKREWEKYALLGKTQFFWKKCDSNLYFSFTVLPSKYFMSRIIYINILKNNLGFHFISLCFIDWIYHSLKPYRCFLFFPELLTMIQKPFFHL